MNSHFRSKTHVNKSGTLPERIGVSARVYYTTGGADEDLAAISDSKIVPFGKGNRGD